MEKTNKKGFLAWFTDNWKRKPLFSTGIALLVMVVLQILALGFDYASFGEWFGAFSRNWINILRNNAGVGIIALGMTFVIISGGIDLVTGIAQLFGIRLAPNFKRPYFSVSLGDFWRRWHISLGSWMRDYVFYPFALTRPVSRMSKALKKKAGTHIARALPAALGNILVFLLVGVWHGAQMNYVLWGLYNGVILAFTALVEPVYKKMNERLPRLTASGGFHLFRILRTFLVVNIGWYFDRCVRVSDAFAMLHKTFFAFNAQQLFDGVEAVYAAGIRHFICGMANGCDLYFFDAARYLRLQHPEVTIEAAIPYSGQADRWRPELRERYAYDLRQCDYQTLVQETYTPGCMMRRNRYMVDASRILIAAFDGRPGGTARTLEYAAQRRLEIIQIPIDSAPAER